MNMIEKVARALCKRRNTGQCAAICLSHSSLNNICPEVLTVWREDAKASIAAMREPTNQQRNNYYEMAKATGHTDIGAVFMDAVWERSIDAALKEE